MDGLIGFVAVGREVLDEDGGAVEAHDGDAVRDGTYNCVEHGLERLVFLKLVDAGAATFEADDECERFGAGVLVEMELLRDAIVGEDEVLGFEREDELALFVADERGDEDEVGLAGEGCGGVGWRRGVGNCGSLCEGGAGEGECEEEGESHDLRTV